MRIQSTTVKSHIRPQAPTKFESQQAPSDSFSRLKVSAAFGCAGAVPILGAGLNLLSGIEGQFNENSFERDVAMVGALSNLVGSAALAGGLSLGIPTATYAGLGMLGVSGLTVAYAARDVG